MRITLEADVEKTEDGLKISILPFTLSLKEDNTLSQQEKKAEVTLTEANLRYNYIAIGVRHSDFRLPAGADIILRDIKSGKDYEKRLHNSIINRIDNLNDFFASYNVGDTLKFVYTLSKEGKHILTVTEI